MHYKGEYHDKGGDVWWTYKNKSSFMLLKLNAQLATKFESLCDFVETKLLTSSCTNLDGLLENHKTIEIEETKLNLSYMLQSTANISFTNLESL